MQALTFLEAIQDLEGEVVTNSKMCEDTFMALDCDVVNVLTELYIQNFRSELITKLFENTVCKSGDYYVNEKIVLSNTSYYLSDYEPSTLDQFISDCKRAEINLIWKKEIEVKYFREVKR